MAARTPKDKRPPAQAAPVSSDGIELEGAAENAYAESARAGFAMDRRARVVAVMGVVLVVLYFFGLVVPKDLLNEAMHHSGYNAGYTLSWFVEDLGYNVNRLLGALTGNDSGPVPFSVTMVRYVVIAISGAGLALCGAVYQGSFRNALVSPSTLGVMSGAGLGMMAWIVFFVDDESADLPWLSGSASTASADPLGYLASSYSLAVLSFLGCLVVAGIMILVLRLAGRGNTNPIMLIITGQVIGGLMGAVSGAIRYYYVATDPFGVKASLLTELSIATFYRMFTVVDVVAIGVPLAVTFYVIMKLRRRMGLLAFDADEARTMGVDTRRMQYTVLAVCTLLTALIVSFCGSVGFVGFMVPHLARRLVGPDFTYLAPAACVLGAVFVLGAYVLVSMTLGSSFETMTGMFISIFGAAVFLVTALSGKGGVRGEFR